MSEATFGTPRFCWPKGAALGREIFEWWSANAALGLNAAGAILGAFYNLG